MAILKPFCKEEFYHTNTEIASELDPEKTI